ncbi:MAG: response regulator transcription factor [Pseudomonadota bacterium]
MAETPQQRPRGRAIDLALANGNPLMLAALSEVIDRDQRFSLVFSTKSVEGLLQGLSRVPVSVAILDWALPGGGGEALIEQLRRLPTPPRVLVYATGSEADIARRAMAAGAAGLTRHDEPPERLLETAAALAEGRMVFPYIDVRSLGQDPIRSLTKRERSLLDALAKGLTNKELARDQEISINTVKFHLRNLFDKLGVRSRAQAIATYYASGEAKAPTPER